MHLMYLGPWDQADRGTLAVSLAWSASFAEFTVSCWRRSSSPTRAADPEVARTLERLVNKTVQRVTTDLLDFQFNTMVAALIECSNGLADLKSPDLMATREWRDALSTLVLLMAPRHRTSLKSSGRSGGDYWCTCSLWLRLR
ncbi:MAG: hypothetical protein R2848_06575 [Thermomicrobiales bacterium]